MTVLWDGAIVGLDEGDGVRVARVQARVDEGVWLREPQRSGEWLVTDCGWRRPSDVVYSTRPLAGVFAGIFGGSVIIALDDGRHASVSIAGSERLAGVLLEVLAHELGVRPSFTKVRAATKLLGLSVSHRDLAAEERRATSFAERLCAGVSLDQLRAELLGEHEPEREVAHG